MKCKIARLIVVTVLLLSVTVVPAWAGNMHNPIEVEPEYLEPVLEFEEQIYFPVDGAKGEVAINSTTYYDFNILVPFYDQNDPEWGEDILGGCSSTLAEAGCAVTSAAMIFDYHNNGWLDPGELNYCMGDHACPFEWEYAADNCGGADVAWVGYYAFSYSNLVEALTAGHPPIVKLTKGGGMHFVVVTGIDGEGDSADDFLINDPENIYTNLSGWTNDGWSLDSIRQYKDTKGTN